MVVDKEKMSHNAMRFDIEAELWAQPLPLRLFLRTEIDLESGSVQVSEADRAGP
jgi:type VI secretion system protein ImpF